MLFDHGAEKSRTSGAMPAAALAASSACSAELSTPNAREQNASASDPRDPPDAVTISEKSAPADGGESGLGPVSFAAAEAFDVPR